MEHLTEQELLNQVLGEFGFHPVSIASVSKNRWILSDRAELGVQMIKIERRLQELTKTPVDLRLLPKTDKNKRFDRNYLRGVEKI